MAISQPHKKRDRSCDSHRRRRQRSQDATPPALVTRSSTKKQGQNSFKKLLPRVGFHWPIFAKDISPSKRKCQLALDNNHVQSILRALTFSRNAVLLNPEQHQLQLDKATVDTLLALLVNAANYVLENSTLNSIAASHGPYPEAFWDKVKTTASEFAFTSASRLWFSASHTTAPVTSEALYKFAIVAITARQHALGMSAVWARHAHAEGSLAKAVDRLIVKLQSNNGGADDETVRKLYFSPVIGAIYARKEAIYPQPDSSSADETTDIEMECSSNISENAQSPASIMTQYVPPDSFHPPAQVEFESMQEFDQTTGGSTEAHVHSMNEGNTGSDAPSEGLIKSRN